MFGVIRKHFLRHRIYGLLYDIRKKNLDGMFCCTPKNGKAMYECAAKGDIAGMRKHLDNILFMRDTMLANGLMMCFTHCMNLLGIEGNFHQDYTAQAAEGAIEVMRETLKKIGEI